MLGPLDQVLAAALDGGAQHLGIGHHEVARRQRIDELAGVEIDLLGGAVVEPVDLAHGRLHPAGAQQVGLLDEVEQVIVAPRGVLEAAVLGRRLDHRRGRPTGEAAGRRLPQAHIVLPQRELGLAQLAGIGHQPRRHLEEGLADVQRVAHADGVAVAVGFLPLHEVHHQALRLLRDARHGLAQLDRVGQLGRAALLIGHDPILYDMIRLCGMRPQARGRDERDRQSRSRAGTGASIAHC